MTQEPHHIFHITTKLSSSTILYGFLVGCLAVGAPTVAYHLYDRQEKRLEALETEIYKYRERAWLFRAVEDKLQNQKSQVRYDVAEAIYTQSRNKKIPISLILAIIEIESNWNLDASSGAAMGVMQIIPSMAAKSVDTKKKNALYDPVTNIIAGCSLLDSIHKQYIHDRVERETEFDPSLCAYNSGRSLTTGSKQLTNYGYALKVKEIALRYESMFKNPL